MGAGGGETSHKERCIDYLVSVVKCEESLFEHELGVGFS